MLNIYKRLFIREHDFCWFIDLCDANLAIKLIMHNAIIFLLSLMRFCCSQSVGLLMPSDIVNSVHNSSDVVGHNSFLLFFYGSCWFNWICSDTKRARYATSRRTAAIVSGRWTSRRVFSVSSRSRSRTAAPPSHPAHPSTLTPCLHASSHSPPTTPALAPHPTHGDRRAKSTPSTKLWRYAFCFCLPISSNAENTIC